MKINIDPLSVFVGQKSVYSHDECEWADMDNPSGAVCTKEIVVEAWTQGGRRFYCYPSKEDVSALVDEITTKGEIDLNEGWHEGYEVYGPVAWQAADSLREMAHQSNPATAGTVRDF